MPGSGFPLRCGEGGGQVADLPKVGEHVTVLPPYENDVYILAFQHYATVSRQVDDGYMITLADVHPPGEEFGPFPADRLAHGWRDDAGRWR
jgi:hypothetical protein